MLQRGEDAQKADDDDERRVAVSELGELFGELRSSAPPQVNQVLGSKMRLDSSYRER